MYKSDPKNKFKLALESAQDDFKRLTRNFDLLDWRTVRNDLYWKSDLIANELNRWTFKVELLQYYVDKGVPLTDEKQMSRKYAYIDRK